MSMGPWGGADDERSTEDLQLYPVTPEEVAAPRRRRSGFAVAASVIATLVLVAGFVVLRDDNGKAPRHEHRQAIKIDHRKTTRVTIAPAPIAAGSPIDGKASRGLPVRAVPDHGLVDGQIVTVVGTGFRPNVQVGAVICTTNAITGGAAECDILVSPHSVEYGQTDAQGRVSITYTFRRYPMINGKPYDCATGNIDPADFEARAKAGIKPVVPNAYWHACMLVIGQVSDYDESGGWPIAMQGTALTPITDSSTASSTTTTAPTTTTEPTTTTSSVPPSTDSTTTTGPTTSTDPTTSTESTTTVTTTTRPGGA